MTDCVYPPMFHWPTVFELLVFCIFVICITTLEVLAFVVTRGIVRMNPRRVAEQCAVQLAFAFLRADAKLILASIFLAWVIGRNFPWKRWGKQLGKKFSGLTEVMRASIERQQEEAFS